MPNEIACHLPRNITSMPREAVRCLFFHGIVSGRCLPERKAPTEAERRGETEIKRLLLLLAQCYPLSPGSWPAVWKPQIAKHGNHAESERRKGWKEEGESMGISSSNRLRERNRTLITPDNRFAKRCKTNTASIGSRCGDRRQTNAGKNPD